MKSVLITGASGGSGFTIAKKFASQGYGVVITSREYKKAVTAAAQIKNEYCIPTVGYGLGTNDEKEVTSIFEDIKKRDFELKSLVLNAANLGLNMNSIAVDLEEWMGVIKTNIGWNFSIAREAAIQMKELGGGAIVFVGSNTYRRAIKNRSAYIASKGGIVALSKALAIDWAEYCIRVNTIIMGSIKTSRWYSSSSEQIMRNNKRIPIGDAADFDDLANAVFFLSTEQSKNITGSELVIDGGVDSQLFPQ